MLRAVGVERATYLVLAMPARRRKKKDKNNDALCTKLAVPEEPPNVFAGTDMEEERQLQMASALWETPMRVTHAVMN